LKLEDLSRVPAETKAAVMQIVEQTKRRSGWRVYRTLAALGVPRSVFYAWKRRESLEDRVGKPCRVYEVLPEERAAICEFALQYPKIGYRKLTWMMVDAGIVCVGESTVYRVLSDADLYRAGNARRSSARSSLRRSRATSRFKCLICRAAASGFGPRFCGASAALSATPSCLRQLDSIEE
jgi:hypothetical protein